MHAPASKSSSKMKFKTNFLGEETWIWGPNPSGIACQPCGSACGSGTLSPSPPDERRYTVTSSAPCQHHVTTYVTMLTQVTGNLPILHERHREHLCFCQQWSFINFLWINGIYLLGLCINQILWVQPIYCGYIWVHGVWSLWLCRCFWMLFTCEAVLIPRMNHLW